MCFSALSHVEQVYESDRSSVSIVVRWLIINSVQKRISQWSRKPVIWLTARSGRSVLGNRLECSTNFSRNVILKQLFIAIIHCNELQLIN